MDKFVAQLQAADAYTRLLIKGVIDEDNTLTSLNSRLVGDAVIVDVSGVERINSCGVRDWVDWLQSVTAAGREVVLVRCSPAIISQVNMVTNFARDAIVHSFFAPYYNPETDEEQAVLLLTGDLVGRHPIRAPTVRDPASGTQLEFDDFEESYFAFVQGLEPRDIALSPIVQQAVVAMTPEQPHSSVHPAASSATTMPVSHAQASRARGSHPAADSNVTKAVGIKAMSSVASSAIETLDARTSPRAIAQARQAGPPHGGGYDQAGPAARRDVLSPGAGHGAASQQRAQSWQGGHGPNAQAGSAGGHAHGREAGGRTGAVIPSRELRNQADSDANTRAIDGQQVERAEAMQAARPLAQVGAAARASVPNQGAATNAPRSAADDRRRFSAPSTGFPPGGEPESRSSVMILALLGVFIVAVLVLLVVIAIV